MERNEINTLKFNAISKIIVGKLEGLLVSLRPVNHKDLKKIDMFDDESFIFENKHELIHKIHEDLIYQEEIAKEAIKLSKVQNTSERFIGYHWEATIEPFGRKKLDVLSVSVILKSDNIKYGAIEFPVYAHLNQNGTYRYREIIHIDLAIENIKMLLSESSPYN